ncbi:MAG: peroxiredoxin [Chthoniobacteraceae bacterium]
MTKTLCITLMGILSFLGLVKADELAVGAKMPAVTGTDQNGKTVDLAAEATKGYTLVYFYPKADTGGCTAQACSIRDSYDSLTSKGVKVFGVSHDTMGDQDKFKQKYHLPFTLLADPESKVAGAFGVPSAKPLLPFFKREAFLFKDGVLVWRDLNASTKTQAADVLKVLDTKS